MVNLMNLPPTPPRKRKRSENMGDSLLSIGIQQHAPPNKRMKHNKMNILIPPVDNNSREKIVIVISVHSHGTINTNPDKNNNIDIKKFPNNFKNVFWKNKGVCGTVIYTNPEEGYKHELIFIHQIHNDYVHLIQKNRITDNNNLMIMKKKENKLFSDKINSEYYEQNEITNNNHDFFYIKNQENYELNEKTKKYVDKINLKCTDYLNKKLEFDEDNKASKIIISIIHNNNMEITHLVINQDDLSDFKSVIYGFKKLPYIDTNPVNNKKETLTFEKIFSILGELNEYDINLYLLDYSCSAFPFETTYDDYRKLSNYFKEKKICSGGSRKRKTVKRKTVKRKTMKRRRI